MFLEHVNLSVADLDASIRFYQALFGIEVRWRGLTAGGQEAAHVGSERQYLALFQAENDTPQPVDMTAIGLNHFGVVVDDLDAALTRLRGLGFEAHGEPVYEPGRRAYFFDPNGVEVELVEYAHAPQPEASVHVR